MQFEFDAKKSLRNKQKHGVDFNQIQKLWKSPFVELVSKYEDEPRRLVIGTLADTVWTVIVTHRDEKIRIISARRAREDEKEVYQKLRKNHSG